MVAQVTCGQQRDPDQTAEAAVRPVRRCGRDGSTIPAVTGGEMLLFPNPVELFTARSTGAVVV